MAKVKTFWIKSFQCVSWIANDDISHEIALKFGNKKYFMHVLRTQYETEKRPVDLVFEIVTKFIMGSDCKLFADLSFNLMENYAECLQINFYYC